MRPRPPRDPDPVRRHHRLGVPSTAHQVAIDLRPDGVDSFTLSRPRFQLHRWNGSRLFSYTVNVGEFDGPYPFH